jgi:hypothetical protein
MAESKPSCPPVSPRSWFWSTLHSLWTATHLSCKRSYILFMVLMLKAVFINSPVLVVGCLATSFSFSSRNLSSDGCHTCSNLRAITPSPSPPMGLNCGTQNGDPSPSELPLVSLGLRATVCWLSRPSRDFEIRTCECKVQMSIISTVSGPYHDVCGHM